MLSAHRGTAWSYAGRGLVLSHCVWLLSSQRERYYANINPGVIGLLKRSCHVFIFIHLEKKIDARNKRKKYFQVAMAVKSSLILFYLIYLLFYLFLLAHKSFET